MSSLRGQNGGDLNLPGKSQLRLRPSASDDQLYCEKINQKESFAMLHSRITSLSLCGIIWAASAVGAHADFQQTRWGMSIGELLDVLPVANVVRRDDRKFGIEGSHEIMSRVNFWDGTGTAVYQLTEEDGLQRVYVMADDIYDCGFLQGWVYADYIAGRNDDARREVTQIMPEDQVRLYKFWPDRGQDYVEIIEAWDFPDPSVSEYCGALFSPVSISASFD